VDLVHLDVSVLDRDRRPVKGLTEKDFTILEDGKPQTVAAFSAVELPEVVAASTPPTAWMRDVAPDVQRNTDVVDRRLIAIILDDATIPFDIAMVKSAREIARLVIERLAPTDLASVIFTRDNRNAQEFTSDRARLLKAVDSFQFGTRTIGLPKDSGDPPAGFIYSESQSFFASVGTLSRVAESLAAVPQRRKAVVYVTVGVPASAEAAGEVVLAGPRGQSTDGGASAAMTEIGAIARRVFDQMQDAYRKAQLANVNVYTVSPAGVGGMDQLLQSERWKGKYVPTYETVTNYNDYLVGIAENTGGRAFPERNEFASALDQVFLENSSYYLLGFSPLNAKQDGKHRRIEVKVNRPGLTVRTRSGYYTDKPSEAKAAAEVPPATAALAGLLPKAEIGLEATAAPFAIFGKPEAGVVVVLTVKQTAEARPARVKERVNLQVAAFTQEGASRGNTLYDTDVTLRPGPAGPVEYEVLTSLALKPGRYQLRMSAHVGTQNKTGSVFYDIDVPDFFARPISLSGVMLTADSKPISTETDRIRAYVPITPTALRAFASWDTVAAFARIYQGGRDPLANAQTVITVTDSKGVVRTQDRQAVPRDLFGPVDRTAEFTLQVPLKGLTPGEYLLTVEATSPRGAAKRDIRFRIR
jgi:VWFA-related protein